MTLVQIALDGAWEDPVLVSAVSGTEDWLAPGLDVAVEIFFGPDLFLGARLSGLDRSERAGFVRQLLDVRDVPRFWRLALDGPPSYLEVGVVNAWKSVGSVVVWRPGDDHIRSADLSPALRSPQPTPVALEAAYDGTIPSWIGRSVSTPTGDGRHLLSEPLLAHVAATFTSGGRRPPGGGC